MPTPDTETLAARVRAVERALTDETTLESPSGCETDPLPSSERGERDGPAADSVRTDGAGTDIEQRLCRLEAAVQALRAALGEPGAEAPRELEDPKCPAEPPEPVTASDATRRATSRPSPSSERRDADWPDDLADDT